MGYLDIILEYLGNDVDSTASFLHGLEMAYNDPKGARDIYEICLTERHEIVGTTGCSASCPFTLMWIELTEMRKE